jgi:hypothetical protein
MGFVYLSGMRLMMVLLPLSENYHRLATWRMFDCTSGPVTLSRTNPSDRAAASLFPRILHGLEGTVWALAYRLLDALPDQKSAMLYSLSAMTSYGHVNLFLKEHWQLMGALDALNGMMLFGLTTAFLFAMIN